MAKNGAKLIQFQVMRSEKLKTQATPENCDYDVVFIYIVSETPKNDRNFRWLLKSHAE